MRVIHKIIDRYKLMLPDNIECHNNKDALIGCEVWIGVTCKRCLKKRIK